MTHKLPSISIPISPILCDIFICKGQTDETGSKRMAKSVKMFGIEYPRKNRFSPIQFEGIVLFQDPEIGTH